MSEQTTSARPVFQPRLIIDGLNARYLLWRIADKTAIAANGCWEWTGNKNAKGYPLVHIKNQDWPESTAALHRVVYEICVEFIPDGMFVCHHCDNPSCLRPDHLFVGTPRDNSDDKVAKGRQANGQRVRKNHDHLKGEVVVTAFLTANQVMEIRRADVNGEPLADIARRFNISQTHIAYIVHGKAWAHLPVLRTKVKRFHRLCPKCGGQIDARFGRFDPHVQACNGTLLGKE